MKRFFIIFSVLTVVMLAFWDAKTRMEELDTVAATTPAQVEMKTDLQKSTGKGIQQKTDNAKSQITLPQNQNHNPKAQNSPQKMSPGFRPQPNRN